MHLTISAFYVTKLQVCYQLGGAGYHGIAGVGIQWQCWWCIWCCLILLWFALRIKQQFRYQLPLTRHAASEHRGWVKIVIWFRLPHKP